MSEISKLESERMWRNIRHRGLSVQLFAALAVFALYLLKAFAEDAGFATLLSVTTTYMIAAHIIWVLFGILTIVAIFKKSKLDNV